MCVYNIVGIGWGMVVVSGLVAIYYNMIIGWALYYLIASFIELPRDDLPWTRCIKGDAGDCKYLNSSLEQFKNSYSACTGKETVQDSSIINTISLFDIYRLIIAHQRKTNKLWFISKNLVLPLSRI